jgi:hypothetical protein
MPRPGEAPEVGLRRADSGAAVLDRTVPILPRRRRGLRALPRRRPRANAPVPNKLASEHERDAIAAASMAESGVLPDAGGWQDQAHTFVQAYPVAFREIYNWRKKHEEIAARKA